MEVAITVLVIAICLSAIVSVLMACVTAMQVAKILSTIPDKMIRIAELEVEKAKIEYGDDDGDSWKYKAN